MHPLINLAGIGIQDGSREDMEGAIAAVRARGTGIFAMKPLGGGHLIGDNRAALEYAIRSPLLDAVAVGMQSVEEIDANVALFDAAPDAETQLQPLRERKRQHAILVLRGLRPPAPSAAASGRSPSSAAARRSTRSAACSAAIARASARNFA